MPPLELVSLVEWKTGGNDDNDLKASKADGWGVGTEAAGSRGNPAPALCTDIYANWNGGAKEVSMRLVSAK